MSHVTRQKQCRKCGVVKPADDFHNDKRRRDGKFPYCKDCRPYCLVVREQPDSGELTGRLCPVDDVPIKGHRNRRYCSMSCKDRVNALKGRFGLSIEQYRRMLADTNGICPICEQPTTRWSVDHNHTTGHVTGVVCVPCNVGLLMTSKHDCDLVRKLLEYLDYPPAKRLKIVGVAPMDRQGGLHNMWSHRAAVGGIE